MKSPLFSGTCTAMVTPFLDDKINYPMLQRLLIRQMEAGIEAVVLFGTTGECATLSDDEKTEILSKCKNITGDQLLLIAATGSNNTEHAVQLSKKAQQAGADGLLVISPYCNKATENGLITHYSAIAQSVTIPIILYNVPSRTGLDMPVSAYRCLSNLPNVVGVKEASTDMEKILKIRTLCPESFQIWCGNDSLITPCMALGAQGVISVISNLLPHRMKQLTDFALSGNYTRTASMQRSLYPLMQAVFREINPVGIKAAMSIAGFDCGGCRLPLGNASEETLAELNGFFPKKSAL